MLPNSCPTQPHLAVELLVQQDVPCSNVSVDKGLTSQVGQTLSHLAAELEQCDREGWVCGLRSTIMAGIGKLH